MGKMAHHSSTFLNISALTASAFPTGTPKTSMKSSPAHAPGIPSAKQLVSPSGEKAADFTGRMSRQFLSPPPGDLCVHQSGCEALVPRCLWGRHWLEMCDWERLPLWYLSGGHCPLGNGADWSAISAGKGSVVMRISLVDAAADLHCRLNPVVLRCVLSVGTATALPTPVACVGAACVYPGAAQDLHTLDRVLQATTRIAPSLYDYAVL
ncbi:hypothetical protein CYMTET_48291 [Cymbomonas tetramitiformis]|uniref:Uncharacterized protein n=1 Tax=Cymbomonas tetramitiformis TaxID=36881 RepID=A0AAE0BUA4_9CHLO|nr:hypothetical protein CYMTET_48291 [Cymbomonas tetramitiformis]